MQIFISVHNQDYILELEKNRVFRNLSKYKYIFLGMNPVDRLGNLKDKVIVARDLPDNIENQKPLLDFTGWYAISRNKLVKDKHLAIIHYDCLIYKNFEKEIKKAFKQNKDYMISFQPHPITTQMQEEYTRTLFSVVKEVYNIDSKELVKKAIQDGKIDYPAGGSFACNIEWLDSYINWMEKICPTLVKDPLAGLAVERSMKLYNLIFNVKEKYIPEIMKHIYNADHSQEYKDEATKIRHQTEYKMFMRGELFCNTSQKNKYIRFLKLMFRHLIYKLYL